MELRVLKYFLTAAQEKNITKAAEILHITQPTLSRQLMELEEELNARGKRNITLTNSGLFLKERAEEILELSEKTKNDFLNNENMIKGIISIGCVEAECMEEFVDTIKIFQNKYPNVQFDLYNGYGDDIKEKIEKGIADIGVVLEPIDISKYDFIKLSQKEIWGLLVNKKNPLAEKDKISLNEFFSYPIILPKRGAVQNEILNWFDEKMINPNITAFYNLLSNGIIFVEKDLGCAVCMKGALGIKNNKNIKFILFAPEKITNGVIIWKKNKVLSPCVSLFIDEIKNAYRA